MLFLRQTRRAGGPEDQRNDNGSPGRSEADTPQAAGSRQRGLRQSSNVPCPGRLHCSRGRVGSRRTRRPATTATEKLTAKNRAGGGAPPWTGSRCIARASTIIVSCAPGAKATITSAIRNGSSATTTSANDAATATATANEPKAAAR